MKLRKTFLLSLLMLSAGSMGLFAQTEPDSSKEVATATEDVVTPPEEAAPGSDTIPSIVNQLRSDVAALKKLKISGYVQAQYQYAQTDNGFSSFAGGDFAKGIDSRFMVRRGRIKFDYSTALTQYVLQFDATEGGIVIKDAYAKFTEPWLKAFSFTIGSFNRPFGHEIEYSSSSLESPERSRMCQTMYPKEYDLGAMLTIQAPATSPLNFLKFDFALVNGTGPNASDFDKRKDFIGRVHIVQAPTESFKIEGGLSYYYGGFSDQTSRMYKWTDAGFAKNTVDSLANSKRDYKGADLELLYDSPIGLTQLRGEYQFGTQAGTSSSNKTPTAAPSNTTPSYIRSFNGYYAIFTQNLFHSKSDIVLKYDVYDPNSKVSGNAIGTLAGTSAADIKYSTFGLGWIFHWDSNIKITAYYDIVKNESTSLKGYTGDVKDNVFTFRVQYKF